MVRLEKIGFLYLCCIACLFNPTSQHFDLESSLQVFFCAYISIPGSVVFATPTFLLPSRTWVRCVHLQSIYLLFSKYLRAHPQILTFESRGRSLRVVSELCQAVDVYSDWVDNCAEALQCLHYNLGNWWKSETITDQGRPFCWSNLEVEM